jgi:hypothetical protein
VDDRDRIPDDAEAEREERRRAEEGAVAPNMEALGEIPTTVTPTGAPIPFVPPVSADPRETRRLALAVAVGIAVMLLLVALFVWL